MHMGHHPFMFDTCECFPGAKMTGTRSQASTLLPMISIFNENNYQLNIEAIRFPIKEVKHPHQSHSTDIH